ncbi:MAG TPA: hypothetical protein VFC96_07030 [Anaerovoracaceae bacterium]|nr:hypothetical protein [Anaerovoracaceae bacterium]
MKLTFPRIGDSHLYGRLLFSELGIDIVVPPRNSTAGLERGASISPEDICLPFKIMADNLISAWEMGADTVVMPATMGPCRLGEYGELLAVLLRSKGCKFKWILLDSTSAIGLKELLRRLNSVVEDSTCTKRQIIFALIRTYKLISSFEKFEAEVRMKNPYKKKNSAKTIIRNCRSALESAQDISEGIKIVREYQDEFSALETDRQANPLKVLLTGEIYTLIDPFANHYIENSLMDVGVSFEKNISIGWWIQNTVINPFGGFIAERKGNPYMPHRIGGYAKETISEALRCKEEGYDGIIQIFPVGCMPEIVAKSVFEGFSKQEDIPVLSIIFDEMGGDAGYFTRIEAFTDMLLRKREMKNVLPGNRCGLSKHRFRCD